MGKKLLEQLREPLRLKHYSYRTEEAYVEWVRRFILFHNKRHPAEMGAGKSGFSTQRNVSTTARNQALSALLFFYREALGCPITEPIRTLRVKRPKRFPKKVPPKAPGASPPPARSLKCCSSKDGPWAVGKRE